MRKWSYPLRPAYPASGWAVIKVEDLCFASVTNEAWHSWHIASDGPFDPYEYSHRDVEQDGSIVRLRPAPPVDGYVNDAQTDDGARVQAVRFATIIIGMPER
jgi:hypothetical protein